MAGRSETLYTDLTMDALYTALTDATFMIDRASATGETDATFRVDDADGERTVYFDRFIEVDLPRFMKKIYSPKNKLVEVQRWRQAGEGYEGDYEVEIQGTPLITVRGTFTLTPVSGGIQHVITYDASVSAPLIGKQIAKFVEKESADGLVKDFAYNKAHIG